MGMMIIVTITVTVIVVVGTVITSLCNKYH